MRQCARALILNDRHELLVFERRRRRLFGKRYHYYSIPGGGIESGETPEQAVVRELQEEMMIEIVPERLLIHQIDAPDDREHYYFIAHIVKGEPTFNPASEEGYAHHIFFRNAFAVKWVNLDDPLLKYYGAYAQASTYLQECLAVGEFPAETVDMTVKTR